MLCCLVQHTILPYSYWRCPRDTALIVLGVAQRATFLSILSLSGRVAISLALAALSVFVVGDGVLTWAALSTVLGLSALVGSATLLLLNFGRVK